MTFTLALSATKTSVFSELLREAPKEKKRR